MDRSHRPHHSPRVHTDAKKQLIRRPTKRIVRQLYEQKSNRKCRKRRNKPYRRADYPGQTVQMDVKFVPSECSMGGRKYYYQLTAVNECSRRTLREMDSEHSTCSAWPFLQLLIRTAPFPVRRIQTDNGTEFTRSLISNGLNDLSLFEQSLKKMEIEYQCTRIATPRHNGKVKQQHRIDQMRFYDQLRFFSLADGRKQLAAYQRKSNNCIKHCLGLRTPSQVVAGHLAVMY